MYLDISSRPYQRNQGRTVDVGLDCSVKLLSGDIGNVRDRVHDRSIVDQNIDSSPSFNDGRDDPVAALLVSDILRVEQALSPLGSDELFRLVCVDLFFWQVDDRDL